MSIYLLQVLVHVYYSHVYLSIAGIGACVLHVYFCTTGIGASLLHVFFPTTGIGACSSINNLDCTDCVSPRVSTNSLASGLDNWDTSDTDHPQTTDWRRTTTAADQSPASLRRVIEGGGLRPSQNLFPRELTVVVGRAGCMDNGGGGGTLVSRSASCPSVTNNIRRLHVTSALATTSELQHSPDVPPTGHGLFNAAWPGSPSGRRDFAKNLQLGSVESDSFNVTTPTEESQGRVSPLQGADELDTSFQAEADRFLQSAAEREAYMKENHQMDNSTNGVYCVQDSGGGPGSLTTCCTDDVLKLCGGSAVGTDVTDDSSASHKSTARMSRGLARTKCLQWLSSLDEGD